MKQIIILLLLTLCITLKSADISTVDAFKQLNVAVKERDDIYKQLKERNYKHPAYTYRKISTLKHESQVNCVDWSNNDLLASGGQDGVIKISDTKGEIITDLDLIFENNSKYVIKYLKWSSDNRLAIGGINSILILKLDKINLQLDKHKFLKDFEGFTYAIAWSPDNSQLASSYNNKIIIWDISSEKKIKEVKMPLPIRSITWSDDSLFLGTIAIDNTIRICELKTKKLTIFKSTVNKVDFLLWAKPQTQHSECYISNEPTFNTLVYYEYNFIIKKLFNDLSITLNSISHTSDEQFLAAAYKDGTVTMWEKITLEKENFKL
ncbi:MAG: hypothetical protein P4L22_01810 [Candidatus Babeliales bacterium]|nr:hypothetical protein [Candidatus Babeliales bacterium]